MTTKPTKAELKAKMATAAYAAACAFSAASDAYNIASEPCDEDYAAAATHAAAAATAYLKAKNEYEMTTNQEILDAAYKKYPAEASVHGSQFEDYLLDEASRRMREACIAALKKADGIGSNIEAIKVIEAIQ